MSDQETPPPEPPPTPSSPPPDASPPPADFSPGGAGNGPTPKDANERTLGIVMHLLPLAGCFLWPLARYFPIACGVIPPLVLWLIKRAESSYVDAVGKEVVNFQICVGAIYTLLTWFTYAVTSIHLLGFMGCLMLPVTGAVGIGALILMIIAAMAASESKFYRYPYIYRAIK